ncbi:hypothetical protein Glove_574g4 [Diversispora epigaea]|uniref:Uncharacterized protein n=1 Tax=Diversispora epigaea TaxID=1348612 RepID=A0A397G9I5_9GLOM|nr:hypothetical protein Glove_574g4 [Diversispora epigaea]
MSTSYKCPYCNIHYFSNHNDDFNRIEERQSVQEIENLPSGLEITDLFEYGDYDADASVSLEVISNIPEHSNIECLQNEDLDVRSESSQNEDSDVEEFPNESYANLMTLVTKYNLNNKVGNAIIKFFNKHSNLSISPLPKNIETGRNYKMYRKSFIKSGNFPAFCIENEQSYGVQYTENWWKKVKESIPSVAYILSIILYSDTTTTDTLGKGSLHPIYISLGNILIWRRNKEDVKQLLGYLPILSAKDEREKKSSEFKKLVRETFHNSIKFLLDPLFTNNDDDDDGIELKIDNKIFWFFPRVLTIICDWPEACTFSLIYKLTNSNYLCHFCLVSKENLNNTRLKDDQMVLRNKENML